MSFQPTPQHTRAFRKEEAALQLYNASLVEFKGFVMMGDNASSDASRATAHARLDTYLDAHASAVALVQRDIDEGLAP